MSVIEIIKIMMNDWFLIDNDIDNYLEFDWYEGSKFRLRLFKRV